MKNGRAFCFSHIAHNFARIKHLMTNTQKAQLDALRILHSEYVKKAAESRENGNFAAADHYDKLAQEVFKRLIEIG